MLCLTDSNIIKKAEKSSDVQLAKNLNTVLTMAVGEGRVPASMYDVLYLCSESGYLLENLNPTSEGYYYAWDSASNKILYICSSENDLDTVEYPEDVTLDPSTCWITVGDQEEAERIANAGYNLYLKNSIDKIELHNVAVSIDTGACTLNTLTIDGVLATEKAISLTGNFSNTTSISASNISFTTSGTMKSLTIGNNVTSASLGSNVGTLTTAINSTSVSGTGMVKSVNGTGSISIGSSAAQKVSSITGSVSGAVDGVVPLTNKESIENIRTQIVGGRTFEGETITLENDIDMGGIAYMPMSNYDRDHKDNASTTWFQGTFDGNNKTISNVQLGDNLFSIGTLNAGKNESSAQFGDNSTTYNEANYGLLGTVYVPEGETVTIKNLTITANIDLIKSDAYKYVGDSVSALIGFAYGQGTLNIENVTVNGSIKSFDGCASLIGRVYAEGGNTLTVNFKNCTNNAEIVCVRKCGSFVGSDSGKVVYTYQNCLNNGNVTCLDGQSYDGNDLNSCYEMTELGSNGYKLSVGYLKAGVATYKDTTAPAGFTNTGTITGNI